MTDHADTWTPDLVREAIVEAMRWQARVPDKDGPRGVSSGMPAIQMDIEDRLAEGWDSVVPIDANAAERPLPVTSEDVSRYQFALSWPAEFLTKAGMRDPDMARAVSAACLSEAFDRSFARLLRAYGLGRARGYALRDRGLAIISVRLDQLGVPTWGA